MINIILLIFFVSLVFCLTSGALGLVIANNRGSHLIWSGIMCFFLPIVGQIIITLKPISDKKMLKILHDKKIIDTHELTKTMEHLSKD